MTRPLAAIGGLLVLGVVGAHAVRFYCADMVSGVPALFNPFALVLSRPQAKALQQVTFDQLTTERPITPAPKESAPRAAAQRCAAGRLSPMG